MNVQDYFENQLSGKVAYIYELAVMREDSANFYKKNKK